MVIIINMANIHMYIYKYTYMHTSVHTYTYEMERKLLKLEYLFSIIFSLLLTYIQLVLYVFRVLLLYCGVSFI